MFCAATHTYIIYILWILMGWRFIKCHRVHIVLPRAFFDPSAPPGRIDRGSWEIQLTPRKPSSQNFSTANRSHATYTGPRAPRQWQRTLSSMGFFCRKRNAFHPQPAPLPRATSLLSWQNVLRPSNSSLALLKSTRQSASGGVAGALLPLSEMAVI